MDEVHFSKNLILAITAARKAGTEILKIYRTDFFYSLKKDNSEVTAADLASDAIIKKVLKKTDIPIISEESETNSKESLDTFWVVDPLDGTASFVKKDNNFAVSIGLVEKGEPICGVVYAPVPNKLYVAEKGMGAYKYSQNTYKRINVSSTNSVKNSKVYLSINHLNEQEELLSKKLEINAISTSSAALKLVSVAKGDADASYYITPNIKIWDVCGGHCILNEAGGKLTSMIGKEVVYSTKDIFLKDGVLASNKIIHKNIVDKYLELF